MNTNERFRFLVGLAATLATLNAVTRAEDIGTAFSYQGFLENPAGTPVNDTCTFEFKLCDSAAGACLPGMLSNHPEMVSNHPGIVVTEGVFTVLDVDFGAAAFTGQARWLEVYVQCTRDPGLLALSPRVELTPTPHAMSAERVGPPGVLSVTPRLVNVEGVLHTSDGISTGNTITVCSPIAGSTQRWISSDAFMELYVKDPNTAAPCTSLTGAKRALRLEPGGGAQTDEVNLIGGHAANNVTPLIRGATIGGGGTAVGPNSVTAHFGTVGGGVRNTADRDGTVGGGGANTASGLASTVSGGLGNTASESGSTIGGGDNNTASGISSTVPGGRSNSAGGYYSFAAGLLAKVRDADPLSLYYSGDADGDNGTFVWADSTPADFTSTGPNQFLIRATGGMGIGTTLPEHQLQVNGNVSVYGNDSTLLFGQENLPPGTPSDPNWGEWGIEYWQNPPGSSGGGLNFWKPADSSGIGFTNNVLFLADNTGNVGINTNNPLAALHVGGTPNVDGIMFPDGTLQTSAGGYWALTGNNLQNTNTGNVGIGTTTPPNQKFVVDVGNVPSRGMAIRGSGKEVRILANNPGVEIGASTGEITFWHTNSGYNRLIVGSLTAKSLVEVVPDYVFEADYALLPLEDLETYVKTFKHLPGVPTAKEIEHNGLNITETQLILLKKVEELTLHMINLNKQNAQLQNEINGLKGN